ncbi:Sip1-related alpha-galactosidase [Algisphaera agarilytica]|uniref:Sip1-related alpha-galactosidase n=1 Tax=Algisphaera agarilytica TaxID=1385975 RepID=UPI001612D7CD|nr:Sip1-related alpha-galactosidase [Algisphaera agarilytica]
MKPPLSHEHVVTNLTLDDAGFAVLDGSTEALELPSHGRMMALRRNSPYWTEPAMIGQGDEVPEDTILLLWERHDPAAPFGAILPLASGKRRASLAGGDGGLRIVVDGPSDAPAEPVAAIGAGSNPRNLVAELAARASARLGTFKLRSEKPQPAWADRLGWCTWNAFYHEVTAERVFEGLQRLHEQGIHPSLLILDDGWLQHTDQKLTHFEPDPTKFPDGLKPMIDRCKSEFGVEQFGVWHTLQGYWHGVHPDSPLADHYRIVNRPGNTLDIENPGDWLKGTLSTVHPDDIGQFFDDWHGYLADSGVDMVKVDNQGGIMYFGGNETQGGYNRVRLAHAYRNALHASGTKHFNGEVLNCMSMNNTLATAAFQGNATRNSDDYFPARVRYQGKHIHTNAKNGLWTDCFAVADWDMFQSDRTEAHMHAVARAISGGPVYLADKPGEHDGNLARTLADERGHVLRYNAGSGMPTNDRWFDNPEVESVLLKIQNTQRDAKGNVLVGAIALFHCGWEGNDSTPTHEIEAGRAEMPANEAPAITDHWSPQDIEGLEGKRFAAWSPTSQNLIVLHVDSSQEITLKGDEAELFNLTPIQNGFAPLGILDRLSGGAAILDRSHHSCVIGSAGRFGAYVEFAPKRIEVDGKNWQFTYDTKTKLMIVDLNSSQSFSLSIFAS